MKKYEGYMMKYEGSMKKQGPTLHQREMEGPTSQISGSEYNYCETTLNDII